MSSIGNEKRYHLKQGEIDGCEVSIVILIIISIDDSNYSIHGNLHPLEACDKQVEHPIETGLWIDRHAETGGLL